MSLLRRSVHLFIYYWAMASPFIQSEAKDRKSFHRSVILVILFSPLQIFDRNRFG